MVLGYLLEKEFKQLSRNPVIVGVLIFYTIMVLFFFPCPVTQELKSLKISIVNSDTGGYAQRLIGKLKATKSIEVQSIYPDYPSALNDIERGETKAVMVFPKDFSEQLQLQEEPSIQLLLNAVDGTQAGLAQSYLLQLVQHYSKQLRMEELGLSQEEIEPIAVLPTYRYNSTLNYKYFMLPALLVIMLTMYCSIFPAMSIVQEKEKGTLQQLNVTPIRRSTLILSKIIPFWILAIISVLISIPVIYWVYGLAFQGSILLYLFYVLIFAIALSFMGVILSNFSETLQQAMFLTLFFILIFFLMSGLFSPVDAMPAWAKVIAYANPLTYFNRLTRMVYLRGSGFLEIVPDLLALLVFLVVFGVIAVVTHKKRAD